MTFQWPHLFWLLAVPLLLALLELRRRGLDPLSSQHPKIARAEAGTTDLQLVSGSAALPAVAPRRLMRWRLYLGLALLITALARPQWGKLDEPVFDQAREIIIALDLSRSMLATDIRPSRLERGKLLVTSLLERLAGERVGLVVFAGTAFLQSPLSSDYEILSEFLPALTPEYLPQGGSNYQALIDTVITGFSSSGSADRFLIVLSDGESTEDRWREAAKKLQEKGIRVLALGIGTAAGSILPDSKGGYIKDARGAVVLSKLEPATLQELASMTNGIYVDASSWVDLSQLIEKTVDTGRKGQFREQRHARFVERFQWALAPALLFFFWSFYRDFPVRPTPREVKLKGQPGRPSPVPPASAVSVALLSLTLFATTPDHAQSAEPSSASEPLSQLVAQSAAREALTARDYAALAQATVAYGQRVIGAQQEPAEGALRDGLAAVDQGAALDPKAADWPTLRKQLEEMQKKEEPPEQKQDPQDQQQEKDDKGKQDKQPSKPDAQNNDSEKKAQDSQKQQEEQEQQKSDQKQNEGQKSAEDEKQDSNENQPAPSPPEPPKSPQSAFGDMNEKTEEKDQKAQKQAEPPPTPAPSPETQRIEPKEKKDAGQAADPALVVPLQRLQQVRNQDDPVKLQKLMRGEKETPAQQGKNW